MQAHPDAPTPRVDHPPATATTWPHRYNQQAESGVRGTEPASRDRTHILRNLPDRSSAHRSRVSPRLADTTASDAPDNPTRIPTATNSVAASDSFRFRTP